MAALDGIHVWTSDYAEQRFRWRPKAPLLVLVLRVYRLHETRIVPVRDHYAGCASWVPMHDLPADPRDELSTAVLDDAAFEARFSELRVALPDVSFALPVVEND